MGAPKQKWTEEEESAIKAGVVKHGPGKWSTILKDPEFSGILCLRSNVDLKDKWRNLSVTTRGLGSREKARTTLKRSRHISKHDDNPLALSTTVEDPDDEFLDAEPLAVSSEVLHTVGPKKPTSKQENPILEAIKNLKEATGSNKTDIALYIEAHYWPPPDFKEWLSAKLKALTASGKLIKVKRKYRIAPSSDFSGGGSSNVLLLEGRQKEHRNDFKALTKSQIDSELAQMTGMTTQEAAEAAARAVAEAEAAIAEAEEAAREAEAAEADAEAAQAFAEAAMLTLKNKNAVNLMVGI